MSRVIDVRLVVDREDEIQVSIDGRLVVLPRSTTKPSDALALLALAIDGCAWGAGRTEVEEIGDPASVLYRRGER